MSQHTCSHKNSLNLFGEKYLNESPWPMCRIRLLECNNKLWIIYTIKPDFSKFNGDFGDFSYPADFSKSSDLLPFRLLPFRL